jgi:hypothetical protein
MRRVIFGERQKVGPATIGPEKVSRARSLMEMLAEPEVRRALAGGAALMMVPLMRDTGRPTKANVSIDSGTLAAIDEEAAARGLTRSAFIAGAAREKIRHGT